MPSPDATPSPDSAGRAGGIGSDVMGNMVDMVHAAVKGDSKRATADMLDTARPSGERECEHVHALGRCTAQHSLGTALRCSGWPLSQRISVPQCQSCAAQLGWMHASLTNWQRGVCFIHLRAAPYTHVPHTPDANTSASTKPPHTTAQDWPHGSIADTPGGASSQAGAAPFVSTDEASGAGIDRYEGACTGSKPAQRERGGWKRVVMAGSSWGTAAGEGLHRHACAVRPAAAQAVSAEVGTWAAAFRPALFLRQSTGRVCCPARCCCCMLPCSLLRAPLLAACFLPQAPSPAPTPQRNCLRWTRSRPRVWQQGPQQATQAGQMRQACQRGSDDRPI